MDKFVITGGTSLTGEVTLRGAKNVALKIFVAALLTDELVVIRNVPEIADVKLMLTVLESLGVTVAIGQHEVKLKNNSLAKFTVPLEIGARLRTSSLVLGPLLARGGEAKIPNPGGCRIGARPIDRHIEGLKRMGAEIVYNSADGFFHARTNKLHGVTYEFPKNTHTGTETMILAAVLAEGQTVLKNAAEEVEIDDLIACLNLMGAQIKRVGPREIVINGVRKLQGVEYAIMPDRNEEVTFAVAAAATNGDIIVTGSQRESLKAFLTAYRSVGGNFEALAADKTRYWRAGQLKAAEVVTAPHPGFMTDWQAPWALLMTQAQGSSTIHETVFESRFSYVRELTKMGAQIEFFDPPVSDPRKFYNFNWNDRQTGYHQGIRISGPTPLHNAILQIDDLRAGATLLLAALIANGESYIHGVEQVDRGYEKIEERLRVLGAKIVRAKE